MLSLTSAHRCAHRPSPMPTVPYLGLLRTARAGGAGWLSLACHSTGSPSAVQSVHEVVNQRHDLRDAAVSQATARHRLSPSTSRRSEGATCRPWVAEAAVSALSTRTHDAPEAGRARREPGSRESCNTAARLRGRMRCYSRRPRSRQRTGVFVGVLVELQCGVLGAHQRTCGVEHLGRRCVPQSVQTRRPKVLH